jgi:hypothetical protein
MCAAFAATQPLRTKPNRRVTEDLKLMASAPANRIHPPPRTIAGAFNHLARMGGHLRSNGLPDWQVLARAYKELLAMRYGYEVAMAQRSDQF